MSCKRIVERVDLTAVEHNIKALYNHMPEAKPIMAVIKSNGYGHGAVAIAKHTQNMKEIFGYATATAEEALELREAGITKPILILGYVFEDDYEELIKNNIWMSVFDVDSASRISEVAAACNLTAKIHLKVDTGMSRIGVQTNEAGLQEAIQINKFDNIEIIGVFTHLARADELDLSATNVQLDKFFDFVDRLKAEGINPEYVHCANSASILQIPRAQLSFVRAGIVIYGLWPSDEMMQIDIELKPIMSLISHIVYIKEIDKGTSVSYGGTYKAESKVRVATVPVGYADGYPRALSNKGYVLINGKKAPILGRVCMDQLMVDVTDINAKVLDEVVLIGKSIDSEITVEELGNLSGRFNYEFVCDITPRVERVYIK